MKRIFFYISCFLFLTHFLLLSLNKVYPNRLSTAYTYPFFQQNWDLFAPPPDNNYKLYAVMEDDRVNDVLGQIKNEHLTNLLAGNEALLLTFSNSIHFFEKEAVYKHISPDKAAETINFKIIIRSVEAYYMLQSNKQVKRIILLVSPLKTDQKPRIYHN